MKKKDKQIFIKNLERSLKEWNDRRNYIKMLNEFHFKQRIKKAPGIIKSVDDNYVKQAAKVMFGEDVELTRELIEELRPSCIDSILDKMFPMYPEDTK